jgi:hypothetical protein
MEKITTPSSLDNTLYWGDQNIPDPIEEVAYLELITYNKRKQTISQERTEEKNNIFGQYNHIHNRGASV